MDALKANTPEELYQAIGEFLQSDYSHENLVKIYNNSLRCAASFRGIYSDLPILPEPNREDPLYGLQYIMDWSKEAAKVVDDIASNLEQQTISEVISQLKKLRGIADSALSLVDTKLKEQVQKEARAKVEKEYRDLNEKAEEVSAEAAKIDISKMLLIPFADYQVEQAKILGELQQEEQKIKRRETEDIVQIYLSKDPTFKDRVSQLGNEICEALKRLNKLIGSDTSTGKLLDIYCKLKSIPLQRQFDDVGYAYSPIDDWADVICGRCNRLYTSIDNVIKTFEEIQTKAKLKTDETHSQKIQELHKIPQIKQAKNGEKRGGDIYNINGDYVGQDKIGRDKAGLAETEPENKDTKKRKIEVPKPWYKKIRVFVNGAITIFAAIAAIVMMLFGDNIWGRLKEKRINNKPAAEQSEIPKTEVKTIKEAETIGDSSPATITSSSNSPVPVNYVIESLTLEANDCLNDRRGDNSKDDKVRIRLFAAGKEIENSQEDPWLLIKEGSEPVDINSFKFDKNFKETDITVRLIVKDEQNNDKEIQIDEEKHIDLKEKNKVTLEFSKHYPAFRMTTYSLTYKISQKESNKGKD